MPRKVRRRVIPDRETVHQRTGLARRERALALGPAVSCAGSKRGLCLGAVAAADSDLARTTHCGFLSGESFGNDSCRLDLEPTDYDSALRDGISHRCISHRNSTSTPR
jgi:hypothetical protein